MATEDDKHNRPPPDAAADPTTDPANPENRIALERQAADPALAAKIEGVVPERVEPDAPAKADTLQADLAARRAVAAETAAAPRVKTRGRGPRGVAHKEVPSTGHEWDGIREYDNPLPRWWLYTFYLTIAWAVFYMIAYPAIPLIDRATQGLLGHSTREEVAAEIQRFQAMNAGVAGRLAAADLTAIAADPELVNYAGNAGGAVFRTYCAQCHGSGAAGARGYPNLLDNDWLWGGDIAAIHTTVTHGIRNTDDPDARYSEMPRFGADGLLEPAQVDQVTEYVLAMAGQDHDAALAGPGAVVYAENCAACHLEDGSGDVAQGAPALNDAIWLYGGDRATVRESVHDARFGVMPPFAPRLSEAELAAVAHYVHGLGGGE